jgi:hypothetical protein
VAGGLIHWTADRSARIGPDDKTIAVPIVYFTSSARRSGSRIQSVSTFRSDGPGNLTTDVQSMRRTKRSVLSYTLAKPAMMLAIVSPFMTRGRCTTTSGHVSSESRG